MRVLRKVLFWLFLALYLTATPIAVMYALGYLYKPGTERGLTTYGLISINSTPEDAQIFFGESRFARRTPAVIRDLLPGSYQVRLIRPGYAWWQGPVRVESERATVIDRVILLPSGLQPQRVAEGPWTDLQDEPGDRAILLSRGPSLGHWRRLDAARESIQPLLATNSPWADLQVDKHWLAPDSDQLLVEGRITGTPTRLWLRMDDPDEEPVDITRLFPDPPDEVLWDARSRSVLFARIGERLHRIEVGERALYPDYAAAGRGIALRKGRLLVLDGGTNTLVRIDRDGEGAATDYSLPEELMQRLIAPRYRIFALPDERALFLDQRGALLANRPPWLLVPDGARALLPGARADQWLVIAGRQLMRLAFTQNDDNALRWETLYAHSKSIQRAAWVHDDTHILFSADGQMYLLALERGGGGVRHLVETHRAGAFHFSEASGLLYYLDPSRNLSALRLLPPDNLIPLPRHSEGDE